MEQSNQDDAKFKEMNLKWWSRLWTKLIGRENEGYFKSVENIEESNKEYHPAQSPIYFL